MRKSVSKLLILFLFLFHTVAVVAESPDPVQAGNAMVVSADAIATDVGVQILKDGGNAVDAAVAVGFALAVTFPRAGNIGGGGFMVIRLADGTTTTLDYREKAPAAAHKDMYLDEEGEVIDDLSVLGPLAAGVPGSVAGMLEALNKYGTMTREEVLAPAIRLAEAGFPLPLSTARTLNAFADRFLKFEATAKYFTKPDTVDYEENELFIQQDLAETLKRISEDGRDGFYKGKTAELIVAEMERTGGIITPQDLADYTVVEREPVSGTFRDHTILSMPPASSGGIALVQLLNIMEQFEFTIEEWGSSRYLHHLVEAMKQVYADRAEHLGDSDYYQVPMEWLTSKIYAKAIASVITDAATPSDSISAGVPQLPAESSETTHYSVYDSEGSAVSVTTTINSLYGNKQVVNGAGFFLNNEMDDFSSKPGTPNQFGLIGSEANAVAPGKRMLSSMTPTIVLRDDKPYILIGSPGGSTIITTVFQVIMNAIEFDMDIQAAINKPRVHHQWKPPFVVYEHLGTPLDVLNALADRGHTIGPTSTLGRAQGIMIDHKEGIIYGGTDARGNGKAGGY